jgi:hypothetical protein
LEAPEDEAFISMGKFIARKGSGEVIAVKDRFRKVPPARACGCVGPLPGSFFSG